jgi:site-specific recombinase XerD
MESKLMLQRFPHVAANHHARAWLGWQSNRGLEPNTLEVYGRGLETYLAFLSSRELSVEAATRFDVASYVRQLLPLTVNETEAAPDNKSRPSQTLHCTNLSR